ncbi:MAG: hypothetical protein KDD47_14865 [Acidobacteria bacterium]|nr:hypothetical protein [Acidobacteriota bacterium]
MFIVRAFSFLRASSFALTALGMSILGPVAARATGPDLVPVQIGNIVNHGQDGTFQGYSVGVATCNLGDSPSWFCDADSPECAATDHPILVVNLYRVRRSLTGIGFDQIGMSWVQHLTASANGSLGKCGSCQAPPLGSRQLGAGCADTLTGAEASVRPLARRSTVNPATVSFPFPFISPLPTTPSEQRLRVARSDLDPAGNPGARFFLEVQVLAADDLAAGNSDNNFVYREVTVDPQNLDLIAVGPEVVGRPAIFAWRDVDPYVQLVRVEVPGTSPVEVFYVARAYFFCPTDDFGYHKYVIQNVNSDLAAQRWAIEFRSAGDWDPPEARTLPHHSGEPYATTPWVLEGCIFQERIMAMSCPTFAMDPDANALRWGTAFSFRADGDTSRASNLLRETFDLFKPWPVATVELTFPASRPQQFFSSDFETGDLRDWSGSEP